MSGKQAKVLTPNQLADLLTYAGRTRYPARNTVLVLLSVKAGLRAGEIAQLAWGMVLDSSNQIGRTIEVRDAIAKGRRGRRVPLHPALRTALLDLFSGEVEQRDYIIKSERGGSMHPVNIVHWFRRAYDEIGAEGCSSHSGRRTFITKAARAVGKTGGSLRDVQLLAGHASIQTTQRYIDGDTDAQHRLVAMI